MKAALLLIMTATNFLLFACTRNDITVMVSNVGAEPLHKVVVHVTGNSYPVGDLLPGSTRAIAVKPSGESHVEVEFAGHPRLVIDSYFEAGYHGKIEAAVTQEKVVAVRNSIEP